MKMLKIKGDATLQQLYKHMAVFHLQAVLSAFAICKYFVIFFSHAHVVHTFGKLSIRPAT